MPEHTIAENLARLQAATAAIGEAITQKGGIVSDGDGLEEYPADILTIPNATIYGFHIDPDESDPSDAVTYLMDAVGMEPAKMGTTAFNYGSWKNAFFMPKPCMLKYDGTVDYYLDPNDYSKKADGTASDVADPTYEGNAMMEWPLIWYKFEQGNATGEGYFYCSNRQVDETYICDCNRDANGDIIPHFYTAIYNGTGTDKLRSLSGVQLTSANGSGNTTGQDELDRALANNTTSFVEWYTDVLCDRQLINALHILVSKSIDSQGSFGQGISTGSKATKEAYVTGSLNNKGMFYGDITGTTTAVKTFGMENWWSCVWRRLAGLIGSADGYLYKTIQPYNTTGSGYSLAAGKPTSHGYVKHMIFGEFGFLPTDVSATSAQFFRDYYYKGKGYALVGGNSSDGAGDGFSCFDLSTPFLLPYWNISAAPSCKPRRKGEWLRMSVANEQTEGKHLCCPYKK